MFMMELIIHIKRGQPGGITRTKVKPHKFVFSPLKSELKIRCATTCSLSCRNILNNQRKRPKQKGRKELEKEEPILIAFSILLCLYYVNSNEVNTNQNIYF